MKICTPISQLLPVKNIDGVFKAVALLNDKTVFINVVGGGDTTDLTKLSIKLKIEKQVKFWGNLPNDKAMVVLKNSDVFVLNSLHEGLPHALIEALSHGVPIVATKIPAFLEILKDNETAVLVNPNGEKDLARGLGVVLKIKNKLSVNGLKLYKEKFTWESHLQKLTEIFTSLV